MINLESVPWGKVNSVHSFTAANGQTPDLLIFRVDYGTGENASFETFASFANMVRFGGGDVHRVAGHFTLWMEKKQQGLNAKQERGFWTTRPQVPLLHGLSTWTDYHEELDLMEVWIRALWAKMFIIDTLPRPQKPVSPKG